MSFCESLTKRYYNVNASILYYKRRMRAQRIYNNQTRSNEKLNVCYYNWWCKPSVEDWFTKFINYHNIIQNGAKINFSSVFGDREIIPLIKSPHVFFSGENVKHIELSQYADYCVGNANVDLSLGFEYFESDQYLRFPLWIRYMFRPDSSIEDIRKRCGELRYPSCCQESGFSSLIARHDNNGCRTEIYNLLSDISRINCPSLLFHNDDDLKERYSDNKQNYISRFRFNICPENSNCYGYVTEKIFEAISAGTIPIYWGSNNEPEKDVLNLSSVILWRKGGDNTSNVNLVTDLYNNSSCYEDFAHQPRLKESAEDYIIDCFTQLEERLKKIVKM